MSKALFVVSTVDEISLTVNFPYGSGNPNVYYVTISLNFQCTDSNGGVQKVLPKDWGYSDFILINGVGTKPTYATVSTAINSSKASIDLYVAQRVYDISGNLMTGYAQTGGIVYLI
jgi:hypothetical protein